MLIFVMSLAVAAVAPVNQFCHVDPVAIVAPRHDTTIEEPSLMPNQLAEYVAVKRALSVFWADPAHARLLRTAQNGSQQLTITFERGMLPVSFFDYPTLVTQDSALAAIFTTHHFAVTAFGSTQFEVMHALGMWFSMEYLQDSLPMASSVLRKNVAVVKPFRDSLNAVGVTLLGFVPLLTDEQVRHYVALKQALRSYWQVPAHAPLLETAKRTELYPAFVAVDTYWSKLGRAYDYAKLVTQDPALARVFSHAHVHPELYPMLQVATWQAMMDLVAYEADPDSAPLPGGMIKQNVAIVKANRQALEGIGVVPLVKLPPGMLAGAIVQVSDGILECKVMQP